MADVIARLLRAARDARRATGEDVPGKLTCDACLSLQLVPCRCKRRVAPVIAGLPSAARRQTLAGCSASVDTRARRSQQPGICCRYRCPQPCHVLLRNRISLAVLYPAPYSPVMVCNCVRSDMLSLLNGDAVDQSFGEPSCLGCCRGGRWQRRRLHGARGSHHAGGDVGCARLPAAHRCAQLTVCCFFNDLAASGTSWSLGR